MINPRVVEIIKHEYYNDCCANRNNDNYLRNYTGPLFEQLGTPSQKYTKEAIQYLCDYLDKDATAYKIFGTFCINYSPIKTYEYHQLCKLTPDAKTLCYLISTTQCSQCRNEESFYVLHAIHTLIDLDIVINVDVVARKLVGEWFHEWDPKNTRLDDVTKLIRHNYYGTFCMRCTDITKYRERNWLISESIKGDIYTECPDVCCLGCNGPTKQYTMLALNMLSSNLFRAQRQYDANADFCICCDQIKTHKPLGYSCPLGDTEVCPQCNSHTMVSLRTNDNIIAAFNASSDLMIWSDLTAAMQNNLIKYANYAAFMKCPRSYKSYCEPRTWSFKPTFIAKFIDNVRHSYKYANVTITFNECSMVSWGDILPGGQFNVIACAKYVLSHPNASVADILANNPSCRISYDQITQFIHLMRTKSS